ncbi:unnamed protein product [Hyaloperonospora brassicae]|uniref:VPS9 domain-containing protein n=1 Tax=Hyaloperonospora brassicae TaxID=162125 RepID=A0AAV0TLV5_HYABA|nr:unnamed protein product [Hyaloperonospora brassicae]
MFWGLRSSSSSSKLSASPAATNRTKAPLGSSQQVQSTATSSATTAPSHVLSEQRRSELLFAARTTRTLWVDNNDARCCAAPLEASGAPSRSLATSLPSSACREALDDLHKDFSSFFTALEELKHDLLPPHDVQTSRKKEEEGEEAAGAGAGRTQRSTQTYKTLFQELSEQEVLLDQWQCSHSPRTSTMTRHGRDMSFLLAFRELLALLKKTEVADVVYRIQSFVKKAELWDLPEMLGATRGRPGERIHDFVNKLVEQIKHSKTLTALLQEDVGDNDAQQTHNYLNVRDAVGVDLLHEVLEAFLMEKLYVKTLTPSDQVAKQDDAFHDRISLLAFVTLKHLDLPEPKTDEQEHTWLRLATQLEAATLYPSPRRKMDGILRVCQDLTSFLKMQNGDRFPSADEFLPALIYVVLRANPRELKRNVAYILEYRNPAKLVSEPGYFFTHLVSSIAFLEEVDCSRLTISAEEFDEGLRQSKKRFVLGEELREVGLGVMGGDVISCSVRTANNATAAEDRKQMRPRPDSFGHAMDEDKTSLRFPTVLDVRAKRLSLMADPHMRGNDQDMHR